MMMLPSAASLARSSHQCEPTKFDGIRRCNDQIKFLLPTSRQCRPNSELDCYKLGLRLREFTPHQKTGVGNISCKLIFPLCTG